MKIPFLAALAVLVICLGMPLLNAMPRYERVCTSGSGVFRASCVSVRINR